MTAKPRRIGPTERVLLGATASAPVFTAGVFAHARYGKLHAAVVAAGSSEVAPS